MFDKLLTSIGIGAAKVDTRLSKGSYTVGETIEGNVLIRGGNSEQDIDNIYLTLMTNYEVEVDDRKVRRSFALKKILLTESFTIGVNEEKIVPFHMEIPYNTPATMGRTQVWIQTGLDIKKAFDPQDKDFLEIKPHPLVTGFIEAATRLGFRLYQVDTEKASILFGTTINNAPDKKFYIECGNRTFDDWNITCEEKCPSTIINAGDEYDGKDTDTRFKKITYKRIFTPGVWETLYLPFNLDSMTITHKEVNEGKPLNINFPWNKEDGGYFHLAVRNGEYFEYIQQKDAKLQGHKAYIIQFPSEAFKDVIVTFTSDGYTDINTTFYQQDATTNHNMYGNTTLKNQELSDAAYYLGNDNNFKYTESYTLKPFECYLTPIVETQSYVNPRMMSVRFRPQSDVTTDVPNINTDQISWQRNGNTLTIQTNGQPVNIYNINGMLIHSFAEGNEQVSIDLDNGCYIINSLGYTQKIIF